MELMGVVGIIVNCALIGQSGIIHRMFPNITGTQTIILIIVLEVSTYPFEVEEAEEATNFYPYSLLTLWHSATLFSAHDVGFEDGDILRDPRHTCLGRERDG